MKTSRRRILYAFLASLFFLAGAAFDVALMASIIRRPPLAIFEPQLWGDSDQVGLIFMGLSALGMIAIAGIIYVVGLDPFGGRRSWGWVFLNVIPASAFIGEVFIFFGLGLQSTPDAFSIAVAVVISLGLPLFLYTVEAIAARVLLGMGRVADVRGSESWAFFYYKNSLRWRPASRETARRCGLLMMETGRFKQARALLEPLEAVGTSQDLEVIRGLEKIYLAEREGELALGCLRRQREIQPKTKDIDQRILDQCVALEKWDDAISELESGRLPMTLDRLAMLQELYGRAGDIAKAIDCSRKVVEKEGPPHARARAFLSSMLERKPSNADLLVELGMLVQKGSSAEDKERGAECYEKALQIEPKRPGLRRMLASYYHATMQEKKAEPHFRRLIDEKEADPVAFLGYADILRSEGNARGACMVYRQMRESHKEDWRGYVKEAEILFSLDQIDEARALLDAARPFIPENEKLAANILSKSLDRRRDELSLRAMTADMSRGGEDAAKRLDYVRQLLALDRGEDAVAECDQLLEKNSDLLPLVQEALERSLDSVTRGYRVRDYLADLYFRQGRYDDALKMYQTMAESSLSPDKVIEQGCRKILARAPGHLPARLALGDACMRTQSWAEAAAALDPLLESPPEELDADAALRMRASWTEAAYRAGKVKEAMALGLKILPEKTRDLPFLLLLIRILEDGGAYEDAFDVFKIAFAAYPEDDTLKRMKRTVADNKKRQRMGELQAIEADGGLPPHLHYEMADLHREFNQIHHAIIHYQRAADDKELADMALTKLAICLCDRRLFDIANETLDKIELTKEKIARQPELKNMFYWLADTLEHELYKKEALKYFKRLFHVDAAFKDVVTRLEKLDSA